MKMEILRKFPKSSTKYPFEKYAEIRQFIIVFIVVFDAPG